MIYTAGHLIETAEDRIARRIIFAAQAVALLVFAALVTIRPDIAKRISEVLP